MYRAKDRPTVIGTERDTERMTMWTQRVTHTDRDTRITCTTAEPSAVLLPGIKTGADGAGSIFLHVPLSAELRALLEIKIGVLSSSLFQCLLPKESLRQQQHHHSQGHRVFLRILESQARFIRKPCPSLAPPLSPAQPLHTQPIGDSVSRVQDQRLQIINEPFLPEEFL